MIQITSPVPGEAIRDSNRRWFWICVAMSASFTLLVGRDVLFRGRTFVPTDFLTAREPWGPPGTTDAHLQNRLHQDIAEFYATHAFATAEAYKQGHLLLWNERIFCGLAVVGDPQLGTFYPLRILSYLLFSPLRALDLFILIHYFFVGLAMYAFVREWGGSGPAALFSSIVWMLCGQTMVWFKYGSGLVAFVFLPLMALALHRAYQTRSRVAAAGAGALWALLFSGSHPQLAFLALVWAAVYAAARIRMMGWRWTFLTLSVFSAVAVGLSAVQLAPFLESLAGSNKTVVGTGVAFERPFRTPMMLLTLLWQRAYGSPIDRLDMNSRWMGVNYFEFQAYLGLVPLALALLAWRRSRMMAWTAVGALVFATFYPAWWLLETALPFCRVIVPHRLFLFGFAMSVLSGFGLEQVLRNPPPRKFVWLCVAGVGGVLALGFLGWLRSHKWVSLANPPYFAMALSAVTALAGITILRSAASPAWKISAALAAVFLDLLPGFLAYNASHPTLPAEPVAIARLPRGSRALVCLPSVYWREEIRNYLMFYGLSTPVGFASQYPRSYAEMITALGGKGFDRWVTLDPLNERGLDLLNVGSVLTADGSRRRTPLPLVWLAGFWEAVPEPNKRLNRLSDPSLDLRRSVVLDAPLEGFQCGDVSGRIDPVKPGEYKVTCDRQCLVVMSESHHSGWKCEIDGRSAPLLRADHALRAVAVPKGEHVLRVHFQPDSVRYGSWISTLALVILILILVWRGWERRFRLRESSMSTAV